MGIHVNGYHVHWKINQFPFLFPITKLASKNRTTDATYYSQLMKRETLLNKARNFKDVILWTSFHLRCPTYRILKFIALTLSLSLKVFGRSPKETLLTYFLTVARSFIAPTKGISWKVFEYRGFLPHQGTTARCLSIGNGVYLSHRFSTTYILLSFDPI